MSVVPGSIFRIDGAIVCSEMQKTELNGEDAWRIPATPNPLYHYGMINPKDGFPMASTDGNEWVIALVYLIDGKKVNGHEISPLRWTYA